MENLQKGFAPLIILIIIAVVAIGGGTYYLKSKGNSSTVFIDPLERYSFEHPAYIKPVKGGEQEGRLTNSSGNHITEDISVLIDNKFPAPMTLEKQVEMDKELNMQNFIEERNVILGNEQGKQLITRGEAIITSPSGVVTKTELRQVRTYAIHDGSLYIFNYTVDSNYFSEHPEILQQIISTFKFLK